MSYLGSLGSIMDGSGLSEVLQSCYGPNAVTHMLTGKAVERAVRGHFLIESALHVLLMKDWFQESQVDESVGESA